MDRGENTRMPKITFKIGVKQIILLLLFLAAMEFLNRPFYLIATALLIFILFYGRAVQVHKAMIPLLILAVSLLVFSPESKNGITGVIKPFCYLICAVLGYNLMEDGEDENQEKQLIKIIFLIALGQFVHFLLNFAHNFNAIGERNMIDFWSKSSKSATGQAVLAAMMIGFATPILFCKASHWQKLLVAVCLILIITYNFKLAGRTLFILIAIALATCVLFKLFAEKKMSRRLQTIAIIAVVACVVVFLVASNSFGLQDKFRETNFFNRFFGEKAYQDLDEDGRFQAKIAFLKQFFKYPWGGWHIHEITRSYAHDILLDTYDEAGIFAFFAMLWFMIALLTRGWKAFANKRISLDTRIKLASFMIVMWVEFMIEPIMIGMQAQFMSFCVIYGALCKFTDKISVLPEGEILDANCAD